MYRILAHELLSKKPESTIQLIGTAKTNTTTGSISLVGTDGSTVKIENLESPDVAKLSQANGQVVVLRGLFEDGAFSAEIVTTFEEPLSVELFEQVLNESVKFTALF
ncbi:hypothetical protein NEDG_00851 [Nematocida displodere]|uniref:Replication factor A3 n=1 Tax=Nematocida displodere TaxID=1805483 RepID=A0A177ED17_9MICR|nr:hypothetical protein NEDG_00851 [Nematocida displodere]